MVTRTEVNSHRRVDSWILRVQTLTTDQWGITAMLNGPICYCVNRGGRRQAHILLSPMTTAVGTHLVESESTW